MPDLKISQLPVASTPLAGTELVPIVQGGTTDQTTVQAIMTSTVPSGTANGVLYLNGSKVATSGSALTFDGTNFTTTGYAAGNGIRSLGGNAVRFYNSANANWSQISAPVGTGDMQFDTGAGEQMRLTSTGLGIGTSSPATKLDVRAAAGSGGLITLVNTTAFANTNVIETSYTLNNSFTGLATAAVIGVTNPAATGNSYGDIYFKTTNPSSGLVERMRLDSSGNLGLGVTPSAWNLGKAIEVNSVGNAVWGATTTQMNVLQNAYWNSGYKYALSNPATYYQQSSGAHAWFTAPSGTAGNAISFTQAMTLDASGNLGVGTTSPGCRFNATQAASAALGAQIALHNNASTAVGNAVEIALLTDSGASPSGIRNGRIRVVNENAGDGRANMQFWTWSGTTDAERARITSGGDLLVGTTSAGAGIAGVTSRMAVVAATANFGGVFVTDSAAYHDLLCWNKATSGDNQFIEFATEGTYTGRGSIDYNRAGGLVRYNTTSDYRAKNIIGPVQNPGATIDALKVYEGVMKGATQSRPMLIAHEAQAHAPYAVSGVKDEVNEDGTPKFQQIDVSSLVPLLLAEIQSLRARVAALESQP